MSFDVFLIGSSDTPEPPAYFARLADGLASVGAVQDDIVITTSEGGNFELFDGGMAALRGLSPGIVGALFAMADSTSSFLVPASVDGVAFRTPRNSGDPPEGFLPVEDVQDSLELMTRLTGGFDDWSAFRDQVAPPPRKGWFARLFPIS